MKHISRSATIYLNAQPDDVLPLFTPLGERLWVEGWNPEFVYPESGEAALGTIFKTQNPSSALQNGEQPPESIWVTVDYDPVQQTAAYISVTPDVAVVRVDIRCEATNDQRTAAEIRYSLTALSQKGQPSLEKMTPANYKAKMSDWEQALNKYLQHGETVS